MLLADPESRGYPTECKTFRNWKMLTAPDTTAVTFQAWRGSAYQYFLKVAYEPQGNPGGIVGGTSFL